MDHTFCRTGLKMSRAEAKKLGVKIGKLVAWKDSASDWCDIWEDDKLVWSGQGCCLYAAKGNYIWDKIAKEEDN